jgi:hypothetical protein
MNVFASGIGSGASYSGIEGKTVQRVVVLLHGGPRPHTPAYGLESWVFGGWGLP